MTRAVIAFGANLGDRERAIDEAVRELAETEGVSLRAISPIYESPALKPGGVDLDSPGYLNGVVIVETVLEPAALLARLHELEAAHGRERTEHWGDRTLDLDLIDVGGIVVTPARPGDLELPHPRAHERAFVLQPWLDVEPRASLPGHGPIAPLRAAATDRVVRR